MNIKYLLLEETVYCDENINYIDLKNRWIEFLSICEEIIQYEEEDILYSSEIYNESVNGISFADWLYTDGEFHVEEKRLLRLLFEQNFKLDANFPTYKSKLVDRNHDENIAAILILKEIEDLVPKEVSLFNIEDCFKIRKLFLHNEKDRTNFAKSINRVFPNLYVGESVKQSLKHFNPISKHTGELLRHLAALNDTAWGLFEGHAYEGEAKVLSQLSSIAGIICTPEGNPQTVKKYLRFEFKDRDGNSHQIACSPHTKLYRADSNDRIYFTWNKEKIDGLPPILIGHIGKHPYP